MKNWRLILKGALIAAGSGAAAGLSADTMRPDASGSEVAAAALTGAVIGIANWFLRSPKEKEADPEKASTAMHPPGVSGSAR